MDSEHIVAKLRSLMCHPDKDQSVEIRKFWDIYNHALDMAIRVVEDRHTISDCCNARCSSPSPPWHCYECEELDIEYGADHIAKHISPEDAALTPVVVA